MTILSLLTIFFLLSPISLLITLFFLYLCFFFFFSFSFVFLSFFFPYWLYVFPFFFFIRRGLSSVVEQLTPDQPVSGSIPLVLTFFDLLKRDWTFVWRDFNERLKIYWRYTDERLTTLYAAPIFLLFPSSTPLLTFPNHLRRIPFLVHLSESSYSSVGRAWC